MDYALSSEVRGARADGSYEVAFEKAKELEALELGEALEQVLATVDEDPILYDALCVRWIVMLVEMRHADRYVVGWIETRFNEFKATYRRDAGKALRRYVQRNA